MTYKLAFAFYLCAALAQGCSQQTYEPVVDDELRESQKAFLEHSIQNTPYTALIRVVDIIDNARIIGSGERLVDERRVIVTADVLETYRGEVLKTISFTMYVSRTESSEITREPIVVSLCLDRDEFFWPGVGAMFEAEEAYLNLARDTASSASKTQSVFSDCSL